MLTKRTFGLCVLISYILLICFAHSPAGAQVKSEIFGDCECDTVLAQTTCTYTILSGVPALSHLIFPIPENCLERFAVTSDFFIFGPAQNHLDQFCGEIFGIKSEQELMEGQTASFTIVYDGVFDDDIAIIYSALKGGANCELFPVPGVIDCPDIPCVEWSIDATINNYTFRKPLTTSAKSATMSITADVPVVVSFQAFANLKPVNGADLEDISTRYAVTPPDHVQPPSVFLKPKDFNNYTLTAPGGGQEFGFSIWTKVEVEAGIKACEYENVATITLTVENSDSYNDGL